MLDATTIAKFLEELIIEFDKISFTYLSRSHNQFANMLATLTSMIQVTNGLDIEPLKIEMLRKPAYHMVVIEESDGQPRYHDIISHGTTTSYIYVSRKESSVKGATRWTEISHETLFQILYQ